MLGNLMSCNMAMICCCTHGFANNMGIPCCSEIVILVHGFPMSCAVSTLFYIVHTAYQYSRTQETDFHMGAYWEHYAKCKMQRNPHGNSMWGRPAAKPCKIDIESNVNARSLGTRKHGTSMSTPYRPERRGGFEGFASSATWNSRVRNSQKTGLQYCTLNSHVRSS